MAIARSNNPAPEGTHQTELHFSVDAALLAELGERLVGQPHIALAELIKNSYDADARNVRIAFENRRLVVEDDGHGMTFDEFRSFWMRVGSTHKHAEGRSRGFGRPLTGSKGVGRLSVQFLAQRLTLVTSGDTDETELEAAVNWPDIARAGAELVDTTVLVTERPRESTYIDATSGTKLILQRLNHKWTAHDFGNLAKQIWTLQPPFRANNATRDFTITLLTGDPLVKAAFDTQLRAVLDIWTARLVGKLHRPLDGEPEIRLTLQFADGTKRRKTYPAPDHIDQLDFEIRVFSLNYRQPYGIKVGEAREYFNEFGGVHVYDAGFHLPYYGAETDWLGVEQDHSHRRAVSQLLPAELQVDDGLTFLPTNSRLFGVVNVDTAHERRSVQQSNDQSTQLSISVTRDRLVDNQALGELRAAVRWALDFYAMQEAQRQQQITGDPPDALPARVTSIRDALEAHRDEIPQEVYTNLAKGLSEAAAASDREAQQAVQRAGLLGALATAGITAIGFEHEISKQLVQLEQLAENLHDSDADRFELAIEILEWLERARATRPMFSFVMDVEHDEVSAMGARAVVSTVVEQLRPLLRDIVIDASRVATDVLLPPGRFAEWSAILQNVLINASNATLEQDERRIAITTIKSESGGAIRIEDDGVGVNPSDSDHLFEPFVRKLELSPERRRMGLGGTGLGLTIVRMLATNLHCQVRFVDPKSPYTTAVEISWRLR